MGRVVAKSKIVLQCIFISLLCLLSFESFSQENDLLERKVSLDVNNESIVNILVEIESKSGVSFSYESNIIDSEKRKSINLANTSITDILEVIFYKTSLKYAALNDKIVIYIDKKADIQSNSAQKLVVPVKQKININVLDTVYFTRIDSVLIIKTDTVLTYKVDTVIKEVHDTVEKIIKIRTSVFDKYNSHWSIRMTYQVNGFTINANQLHADKSWEFDEIGISENPVVSYFTGLSALYTFGNYSLGAGLGYYHINEGVLFDYSKISFDSTQANGMPGDSGYMSAYDTNYYIYSGNNKYKSIAFPLSAGVKYCITPKLNAGADIFLYINYLMKIRGMTISPNDNSIVELSMSDYRKITTYLFVNPFIEYDFLNGISLYFSPNIGWQLSSDFKKTNYYEKKRFFYGCSLGLQYNF